MKKKIKLNDLTPEQYNLWLEQKCFKIRCSQCPFRFVRCMRNHPQYLWINNKSLFSDNFLDQEIEIDVEDENN